MSISVKKWSNCKWTKRSIIPSCGITYFINGKIVSISIYETVLTFSFFIFTLFKLLLVKELVEERSSDIVKKLISYANARQEELTPIDEEAPDNSEIEDENQLSISDITVEAEVIDAPTAEESFFYDYESEPIPPEQTNAVWINPEDEEGLYPYAAEEEEIITTEEDAPITNDNEQAE